MVHRLQKWLGSPAARESTKQIVADSKKARKSSSQSRSQRNRVNNMCPGEAKQQNPGDHEAKQPNPLNKEDVAITVGLAPPRRTGDGLAITVSDLQYTVEVDGEQKTILDNISVHFPQGINAIMGATGAGKSSLIDAIAARVNPQSGQILANGMEMGKELRDITGYVTQDAIICGLLTVRENLMFSANLRLSVDQATKEKRVEDTLTMLRLHECAETYVGTALLRGVSGGEKKRTQIGMELITSPTLLLLDEPTSGLDSKTAAQVVEVLAGLVADGRTVLMAIHQPRYSIFKQFDFVHLLSRGGMVFSGPAVDVLPFFKSYGMECETFNNPADFTLDMLINEEMAHPGEPIPMALKYQPMAADNDTGDGDAEDCDSPRTQLTRGLPQLATGEHSIGWCTQFSVLANRQTKQIYRNPQTVFLPIFANIFMAIVWGTIFYDVPDTGTAVRSQHACSLFQ